MGGSKQVRQQGRRWPEGREGRVQDRRGQTRRQRQRVEKMVDRGTRGKGVRGMAVGGGVGNPALRESAPPGGI